MAARIVYTTLGVRFDSVLLAASQAEMVGPAAHMWQAGKYSLHPPTTGMILLIS